jgi:hypothetical protein
MDAGADPPTQSGLEPRPEQVPAPLAVAPPGGDLTDPADFEMVAATLRADSADLPTFVEVLAGKLEGALPGRVQVERHSRKLLSHDKVVRAITVDLGDMRYLLTSNGAGVVETRRAKAVRGIVLKTEQLELAPWIEAMARDLSVQAASSEQARAALERLLT